MRSIFIHLGSSDAKHLWANIRYINRTFPEINVVVILNDERHNRHLKNLDVEIHWYVTSELLDAQLNKLAHNLSFRSGFWRFSIERIMALSQWHELFPLETFIHIESDIFLTSSFPWQKIINLPSLAWLRFNDSHDCAAILFSPNAYETKWLSGQMLSKINENPALTDMTALSLISHENVNRIFLLPGLAEAWNETLTTISGKEAMSLSENYAKFEGVFDALAIGMWLTGEDPRNNLGWIKRYENKFGSAIDPSDFEYSKGAPGTIILTKDSFSCQLYNLHLHSKQISFFGKHSNSRLAFDIRTSNRRIFARRVEGRVFLSIVLNYLRKNRIFTTRSLRNLKAFLFSRNH